MSTAPARRPRPAPADDPESPSYSEVRIISPQVIDELILHRRALNIDRWDEVWDGAYVVMPDPDIEHQGLVARFTIILGLIVELAGLGQIFAGCNVSDRESDWTKNYRRPDLAIYLDGNPAEAHDAFWLGGPDFAIEILSKGDSARRKLDFYAKVKTRELLLVDRDPWAIELYRLRRGKLVLVGRQTPGQAEVLASKVLPLSFRLTRGRPRPKVEVAHADGRQRWSV